MDTKFTPGPWSVTDRKSGVLVVGAGHNCTVAVVMAPPAGDRNYNARLIANAPELLAALRECTDDLEAEIKAREAGELPRRIARDMATVLRAREVISKAIGA